MFSELSGLSESVQTLTNESVEYSSSISKMTSELESAQALLKALSNDIDAIKKRQADIAKGAWELYQGTVDHKLVHEHPD